MIDVVTLSCNDDPMYWEFWNPISEHWKERFGIHPVLLYYGKHNPNLSEKYGTVLYADVVEGVFDYVAATWGRFWVTKFFPNKMCLIGDIDMFPLSRKFFLEESNPDREAYAHLNADAYSVGNTNHWKTPGASVPGYYHLATAEIFSSVYKFSDSFSDELQKLMNYDYGEYPNGFSVTPEPHLQRASAINGGLWGIDEMYSSSLIRKYYLNRETAWSMRTDQRVPSEKRLCRSKPLPSSFGSGTHIDFHSIRPYNAHKEIIQRILKMGTA